MGPSRRPQCCCHKSQLCCLLGEVVRPLACSMACSQLSRAIALVVTSKSTGCSLRGVGTRSASPLAVRSTCVFRRLLWGWLGVADACVGVRMAAALAVTAGCCRYPTAAGRHREECHLPALCAACRALCVLPLGAGARVACRRGLIDGCGSHGNVMGLCATLPAAL